MGLTAVPAGYCAAIVTHLEMTARPLPRPIAPSPLHLSAWPAPKVGPYRALFARVGTPWLWFSRLVLDDATLGAILRDPGVAVHVVTDPAGIEVGMLELDFRTNAACEIAYFGLVPELAGKGHGRWLMAQALTLAWRADVRRVWVHTCTLDHPSALGFYRAQGFVPFRREVESFPDPRLTGHLPREAAPQVPVIGAPS